MFVQNLTIPSDLCSSQSSYTQLGGYSSFLTDLPGPLAVQQGSCYISDSPHTPNKNLSLSGSIPSSGHSISHPQPPSTAYLISLSTRMSKICSNLTLTCLRLYPIPFPFIYTDLPVFSHFRVFALAVPSAWSCSPDRPGLLQLFFQVSSSV